MMRVKKSRKNLQKYKKIVSLLLTFALLYGLMIPAYASETFSAEEVIEMTETVPEPGDTEGDAESGIGSGAESAPDAESGIGSGAESVPDPEKDGDETAADVGNMEENGRMNNSAESILSDAESAAEAPEEEDLYPAFSAEKAVDGITLRIRAPEGTFPEGTTVDVSRLYEGTAEYGQAQAAMEASDLEYDGFLALDITFSKDGEKIEPKDHAVSVEFSFSQSLFSIPDGCELDVDTLAVQHLPEDENGNIIAVETVASAEGAADGTVEAVNAGVAASFEVDSFSYITIKYGSSTSRRAYLVDEQGNEIAGTGVLSLTTKHKNQNGSYSDQDVSDLSAKYLSRNTWISVKAFADQYGSFIDGYTYKEARRGSNTGSVINWIYISNNSTWYFSDSRNRPSGNPGQGTPSISSNSSIRLIYTKNADTTQSGDLIIKDTIDKDGSLNAEYSPESGAAEGVTFRWEKSESGSEWTSVERTKITGSQYNVSADGSSVNVALDGGAQYFYRVAAYDADGNKIAESNAYKVNYSASLQNGDFEDVDLTNLSQGGNNYQFPNGTTGLAWKTTGMDNQVEIGNDTGSSHPHNTYALNGHQFAELNAEAAGALYQDVLTIPGSSLYWQFYHKARSTSGTDTMYLVIAPTGEVSDITEQSQLEELIRKIQEDPSGYAARGFFLQTMSDTNRDWGRYTGEYEAEGYLTRFFFVAGPTAGGDNTVGNLLDSVSFTTEVPPPDPGKGNLTVRKTVSGLTDKDMTQYSLPVTVTGTGTGDLAYSGTHTFSGFTSSDGGNTYTAAYTFTNLPTDGVTYTVSEIPETYPNYTDSSTVTAGTAVLSGRSISDVSVPDGGSSVVEFNNSYVRNTMSLTVKKEVTGNMGDQNKYFTFKAALPDGESEEFLLKHGETHTLYDLPVGTMLTLEESDNAGYGVTVRYGSIDGSGFVGEAVGGTDGNYVLSLSSRKNVVLVTNHRNVTPDTGIFTDSAPYKLILLVMTMLLTAFAAAFCRRRWREDIGIR